MKLYLMKVYLFYRLIYKILIGSKLDKKLIHLSIIQGG